MSNTIGRHSTSHRVIGALLLLCAAGCGQGDVSTSTDADDVRYATAAELARLLESTDRPTLVEFCVPSGCFRCDAMRDSVNVFAEREGNAASGVSRQSEHQSRARKRLGRHRLPYLRCASR